MNYLLIGIMCSIPFSHDYKTEANDPVVGLLHYELYIDGVKKPMHIIDNGINQRTDLQWWEDVECPACNLIDLRAVDELDRKSREGGFDACANTPNIPGTCQ